MKILILLTLLTSSISSFADWEIISKDIFKSANKYTQFDVESYISELSSYSPQITQVKRTIQFGDLTATIYAQNQEDLEFSCNQERLLTECLYGRYESIIFVINSFENELYAIGHSFILPNSFIRFGNTGVEQEILYFQGQYKGLGKQANW